MAAWSLARQDPSSVPDRWRDRVYLTLLGDLPSANAKKLEVLWTWLSSHEIPVSNLQIQSQMHFLGWMLTGPITRMRSGYFRDYFMEGFEMLRDQDYAIAVYPRLTVGPDQRYAAKVCYVVQLGAGAKPDLLPRSEQVIHRVEHERSSGD